MKFSYFLLLVNCSLIIFFSIMDVNFLIKYKLYRYDFYSHFIMYMLFSFLLMKIICQSKNFSLIFVLLFFPFATEYIQYFYPSRSVDIKDLFNNYYGLAFGIILFVIFNYAKKSKYIKSRNHR